MDHDAADAAAVVAHLDLRDARLAIRPVEAKRHGTSRATARADRGI
jgi:hypothetical protein